MARQLDSTSKGALSAVLQKVPKACAKESPIIWELQNSLVYFGMGTVCCVDVMIQSVHLCRPCLLFVGGTETWLHQDASKKPYPCSHLAGDGVGHSKISACLRYTQENCVSEQWLFIVLPSRSQQDWYISQRTQGCFCLIPSGSCHKCHFPCRLQHSHCCQPNLHGRLVPCPGHFHQNVPCESRCICWCLSVSLPHQL